LSNSSDSLDGRLYGLYCALIADTTGIVLDRPNKAGSGRLLLQNRLSRAIQRLNVKSFDDLYQLLLQSALGSTEWIQFIHCVSTHKTEFFRETSHFDILANQAHELWKQGRKPMQIWSAACSTGEEPLSVAMTLLDSLQNSPGRESFHTPTRPAFQILATDLDSIVLEDARRGVYFQTGLTARRLKSHFLRGIGAQTGYIRAKDHLRQTIRLQQFNLLESTYPQNPQFDSIFCRNVLIYFDAPTRDRIVTKLAKTLAPGGLLFLGHAESFSFREDLDCLAPTVYRYKPWNLPTRIRRRTESR
jgi:chemotaxis protein methyltransferase CheR